MGSIAIIIPARNEAARLGVVLRKAVEFKKSSKDKVSIIVVDNNSSDGTPGVVSGVRQIMDPDIVLLEEEKRGKKNALLKGMRKAFELDPEIIVTLDADLKELKKEHIQSLVEGARKGGMSIGVLPAFLRGKSDALKQLRIEMSGQRAYESGKLRELLDDKKIKNAIKQDRGYGFEAFIYEIFKKRFSTPTHVPLPGLGYVTKAEKGIIFGKIRGHLMDATALYYKWKARRL